MRRSRNLVSRFVVVYFLLIGFSILGYWLIQLSDSFLPQGASTVINESFVIWHIVAEMFTGLMAIVAAFLILKHNPLGLRLALFTCGMQLYTGLNSIGWGLLHDPGFLMLFIIATLGAIFVFFNLMSREEL